MKIFLAPFIKKEKEEVQEEIKEDSVMVVSRQEYNDFQNNYSTL